MLPLYIVKYLNTSRDYFGNLGDTTVLGCAMFTSDFCPRLKNVICLGSLLAIMAMEMMLTLTMAMIIRKTTNKKIRKKDKNNYTFSGKVS